MSEYKKAVDKHSNKNDLIYAEFLERKAALEEVAKKYDESEATYTKSAEIFESLGK